jgi:hypothetical protein
MIVSWAASPANEGSAVEVVMTNDEGTYLTYPESGLRKFERHLDEVEHDVRAALSVTAR